MPLVSATCLTPVKKSARAVIGHAGGDIFGNVEFIRQR
jgi:hypothetical protein